MPNLLSKDEKTSRTPTHYWLALKLVLRLPVIDKVTLVEKFGLPLLFEQTPTRELLAITDKQYQFFVHPDWEKIAHIIAASKYCQSEILCYDDIHYPSLLKQIYDPPLVLFVQGDVNRLNEPQIAVVGSRNASINGRETAFSLANSLVNNRIAITSGLALGIDACAHKGALEGKGTTHAVVATGLDQVYPARHKVLAKKIISSGGTIISEYFPGTRPKAGLFPRRNRIISGLSLGVLVVEATIKSGSLITARCALEQNREVFAVPSSINNPQSKGCHWLIKQGAKLVEESADIIEELDLIDKSGLNLSRNKEKDEESKKSRKQDLLIDSLLASVGYEITPVDTVVSRSKLPTEVVLTRLTMLELRGLVSAVPGGYLRVNQVN